jgi:cytochrome c-type biogenesis protein CcsB
MAPAAFYLLVVGTILLALSFAAHVAHAVLLASGRRVTVAAAQPALSYAGVVTGSFAERELVASDPADGDRSALSAIAWGLAAAAVASIGASLVVRGIVVGRGPWGNLYEFTVAFAFGIGLGYVVLSRRYPIRVLGAIPLGISLALAIYAFSLPSQVEQLVPALQNPPLLTIHVGFAMIAYGIFAMSFAAGVGYLIQGREDRFAWLPSHRTLDEVAYRAVVVGFPIFATMIVLGSWWASIAWSRWWGWDPKETAALVTWLVYAVYLHARNQRGWSGRPAALILVVGFLMVLVTYSGNLWFSGLHAYSGLN